MGSQAIGGERMKGQDIVEAVMAERRMGKEDFFNSLFSRHVAARRIAITRLKAAGHKRADIARVLHVDGSTVDYWLKSKDRSRRKARRLERYHTAKANTAGASA